MLLRPINKIFTCHSSSQSGNVFLAIFGAIALVGLLGASIMTFMKGPLSTSVRLTKMNTAENQMQIGSQVAVMATANQANNGDCDTDGYVEPLEWRAPAVVTDPHPINGGLVPLSLGISKKDPWGTEYGYCVWNHGPTTSGSGCAANMLHGTASRAYPVVAIISAGPDKNFTTTCRDFSAADVNSNGVLTDAVDLPMVSKAAETDDDIITFFTYEEATGVSGGLWSIKAGDPGVAVINKSIESSGVANLKGGVLLPDKSFLDCNDPTNAGVMAKSSGGIEICDGAGVWNSIGGGGGASDAFNTTATCSAPADAGKVRFNSISSKPEFCDGSGWVPFALSAPTGSLVVSPASNYAMNVVGPCSGGNCPYGYGGWTTFTVSNQGLTATPTLSVPTLQGANQTNFEIDSGASTCDNGISLAPANTAGNSCTIVIRAKANGNNNYSAQIQVTAGALGAIVPLYGVGSQFTCGSGTLGWGGIVMGACTGAGGTEPGVDQLIIQEAGCQTSTLEPTCTGDPTNDPRSIMGPGSFNPNAVTTNDGAVNTVTALAYGSPLGPFEYCNNLVKGGYSDWFLPSTSTLYSFHTDTVIRNTFNSSFNYYASNLQFFDSNTDFWQFVDVHGNASWREPPSYVSAYRCVRKHNPSVPAAIVVDKDPYYYEAGNYTQDNIAFRDAYTSQLNTQTVSATLRFMSFNTPITVSVAGVGSPQFRLNGGTWQTTGTASPAASNVIEVRATSPAAYGQEKSVTINIGDDSGTWKIRTYDASVNKNIFVTSTDYNGSFGGLNGANKICRDRANFAGLAQSGTYQALIATTGNSALDNIGWNWGSLQTVGVTATVASSPAALVTSALSAAPNRTEFGTIRSTNVWGGVASDNGLIDGPVRTSENVFNNCQNWTYSGTNGWGNSGESGATNRRFFTASQYEGCQATRSLYCVGPNPDLPNITCPGTVDATASQSGAGSYQVTIPAGCQVKFKLWGSGGSDSGYGGQGGGGGYAEFTETPGVATTYYYTVGGAPGYRSQSGGSSANGFNGGGGCGNVTSSGGGATLLYKGGTAQANLLAVAGGGGGASYGAAGVAAGAGTVSSTYVNGGNGSCPTAGGAGGGGGGYDGASGGGGLIQTTNNDHKSGQGGANWVKTGAGITSSTSSGSSWNPGNMNDSNRPGPSGCGTTAGPCTSSPSDGAVIVIY